MIGTINLNPGETFQERYRLWQGCPTILCTPKGRLFAGWYSGGTNEPSFFNYDLLVKSDDGGLRWSDPILVIESLKNEYTICIDIQLWLDPQNKMWLFWTQRDYRFPQNSPEHLRTYAVICDDPDGEQLSFSEPRLVAPGFLRCQPTVLSDGRIMLCAYDWIGECFSYSISSDGGNTWVRKSAGRKNFNTDFDESMVLERKDGSLWMLARNAETGTLTQTISCDGGENWSDGEKSSIVSPATRFFIKRLPSGRILLIKNDAPKERIMMKAFLSEDDGATWKYSLLIDPRLTSYPDAAIGNDGTIYMVHDRGRVTFKEILISRFTEEDIMAGELVNHNSFLCQIISKAPIRSADPEAEEKIREEDKKFQEIKFKLLGLVFDPPKK